MTNQNIIKGMDDEIVTDRIDNEGIEYFFTSYISMDSVLDPELKKHAEALVTAVDSIQARLTVLDNPTEE